MFDNEIISPNSKIKKIRKQFLRATQEEIAYNVCTKTNISKIESGKQKLTFSLAAGLAKNFNRIAAEKKMDIEEITAEWLMKDESNKANEMFEQILNELNGINKLIIFEERLADAESLIEKHTILGNKKIQLYKLASFFYFDKFIYSKSDEMCTIGLKICFSNQNYLEEAHFYVTKARNNFNKGRFKYALEQLEYAERINRQEDNEELFDRIYFNKAIVYNNMKEYTNAFKQLDILKDKHNLNKRKLLDIKMLYANCLMDQKSFDKAEKEYISILEPAMQLDDKEILSLAYRNLSELYLLQKKYKDAEISIKESLRNNDENRHLNSDLIFASKVMKSVNKDATIYLLQALDICEKKDKENLRLIEKIIFELIKIYEERDDEEGIDFFVQKSYELNIDYSLILQHLAEYYRYSNIEKSVYLSEKSMNKHNEIKDF
jgi:tetratricopeptide (TPR) repeat protein